MISSKGSVKLMWVNETLLKIAVVIYASMIWSWFWKSQFSRDKYVFDALMTEGQTNALSILPAYPM